jgi:hypothetical protein
MHTEFNEENVYEIKPHRCRSDIESNIRIKKIV